MKNLEVGDDAWFVGHCIVTAIKAEARSMLLVGSVATKDMRYNRIYGGVPAVDMTAKLGFQFKSNISYKEKVQKFNTYLREFKKLGNPTDFIKVCDKFPSEVSHDFTYYNLKLRQYIPRYCDEEYNFMKYLLYEKAKFVPKQI